MGPSIPRRYFAENAIPSFRLYQSSKEKSGMKGGQTGPARLKSPTGRSASALLHFSVTRRLLSFMAGRGTIGGPPPPAPPFFAGRPPRCRRGLWVFNCFFKNTPPTDRPPPHQDQTQTRTS